MPLTQASLSTKIDTEIKALMGTPADAALLKKFCDAIAKAVVDEIQANAQVSVPNAQGGSSTLTGTVS